MDKARMFREAAQRHNEGRARYADAVRRQVPEVVAPRVEAERVGLGPGVDRELNQRGVVVVVRRSLPVDEARAPVVGLPDRYVGVVVVAPVQRRHLAPQPVTAVERERVLAADRRRSRLRLQRGVGLNEIVPVGGLVRPLRHRRAVRGDRDSLVVHEDSP